MEILVFVGADLKYTVYLDGVKQFNTTIFAIILVYAEEHGIDKITVKLD